MTRNTAWSSVTVPRTAGLYTSHRSGYAILSTLV